MGRFAARLAGFVHRGSPSRRGEDQAATESAPRPGAPAAPRPSDPTTRVVVVVDDATRPAGPATARALSAGGGLAGAVAADVVVVDVGTDGADTAGGDAAPSWPPGVRVLRAPAAGTLAAWRAGVAGAGSRDVIVLVAGPVVPGRSTPFLEPLADAVGAGAWLAQPVPQPVAEAPPPSAGEPPAWRPSVPAGVVLAGTAARVVAALDGALLGTSPSDDVPAVASRVCERLLSDGGESVLVDAAFRTSPARPPTGAALTPTGGVPSRSVGAMSVGSPASPRPLRWAIRTSVGFGPKRELWGDLHFARGLAAALRERGEHVVVDYRDSVLRPSASTDDVVLLVRGPHRIDPDPLRQPPAVSLLWVISHPDDVGDDELRSHDAVWAAGAVWAAAASERSGVDVGVLSQCTDADRFSPDRGEPGTGPGVLFVGNARGRVRPVVADALEAGLTVTVHGQGWEDVDHPLLRHAGRYLANEDLAAAYRSAGVVLNDHWGDMRTGGFWSNRLFDAAASGARVVTDRIAADDALDATFHGLVRAYDGPDSLRALVDHADTAFPDDAERARLAGTVRMEHGFAARTDTLLRRARFLLGA